MHTHMAQLRTVAVMFAAMKEHVTVAKVQANAARLMANLALEGLLHIPMP